VVLALGAVWWWLTRGLVYRLEDFPETFRHAELVELPHAAEDTRALLLHWLQRRDDWCGLSAPHLRVYERLVVLRTDTGALVTLLNVEWERVANSTRSHVREASLLCHARHWRSQARWDHVHVSALIPPYDDWQTFHLTGRAAHCLQELSDIVDGHWPCTDSLHPLDAMRIPAPLAATHT